MLITGNMRNLPQYDLGLPLEASQVPQTERQTQRTPKTRIAPPFSEIPSQPHLPTTISLSTQAFRRNFFVHHSRPCALSTPATSTSSFAVVEIRIVVEGEFFARRDVFNGEKC
jgi:hypothetical protein